MTTQACLAELSCEPMQAADLDAVHAIETTAYSHPWTRGNLADSLAGGHWARVLRDRSVPAGQAAAIAAYALAQPGVEEMHLLNLTVASSWRGRGLARRLLGALEVAAREAGARQLWLEVRASNAHARQLYEHCGFEPVAVRRAYYPLSTREREDALVMRRELVPTDADRRGATLAGASDVLD